eukprot:TRINITY_DN5901_c0_g1_i1.p1 TRINITY_DN5901_c0_g1~~TRINITY_DN5901_c0_g1_i1.p1  ORF type:complete len:204 (+),score=29.20 TRINITY_DN5901_c0_g1_i1:47-613(+)
MSCDIICLICQLPSEDRGSMNIILKMIHTNGVTEALIDLLNIEGDSLIIESSLFAVAVLSQFDLFRPTLVQDHAFKMITKHIIGPNPATQERVAWILSNLGYLDYGCHLICTTPPLLYQLLLLLGSDSDIVVSSTLRVMLCVARKHSYLHYFKLCDLSNLKSIQNHVVPNIQMVANKLIELFERNKIV